MRYGIAVNTENCMACYNCVMACKDEHCGFATAVSAPQPHEGQFWVNIVSRERGDDNRKVKSSNVALMCAHCDDPACAKAAKNGAVIRRADGIVLIDPEKAKGQKAIADACPIGAIYWNEELQLPQKCTMCAHLLDEGYAQPRCVEACPNQALIFGDLDDPDSEISKRIAQGKVTQLECLGDQGSSVVHLNIPSRFLAGTVFLPAEEEEVAIGAHVKATCECGKVFEMDTNWAGDWEFEDLPKNKKFTIEITMDGYEPVTYEAFTDTDHYVAETYLKRV